MRRLIFIVTLALYGFSAMDMHEWVRVPQVALHFLEHHSDLGHHDGRDTDHHDQPNDHTPFDGGCTEVFCACGGVVALLPAYSMPCLLLVPFTAMLGTGVQPMASGAFTGNVWNPPKA
jgi:hypothetical protein